MLMETSTLENSQLIKRMVKVCTFGQMATYMLEVSFKMKGMAMVIGSMTMESDTEVTLKTVTSTDMVNGFGPMVLDIKVILQMINSMGMVPNLTKMETSSSKDNGKTMNSKKKNWNE